MARHPATVKSEPRALLGPVVDAVLDAGALLQAEFHRPGGPRREGADKAPIDRELEQLLRQRLRRAHDCAWLGDDTPSEPGRPADVWVVAPHNGTRACLAGLRGSTVSVALVRRGVLVLGVVFAPTAPDDAGDLFAWAEGLPARRNGQVLGPIGPTPRSFAPAAEDSEAGLRPSAASPAVYGPGTMIALNDRAADDAAHHHATFRPAAVQAIPSVAYRWVLAAAGDVDGTLSLADDLAPSAIAGGRALLHALGGDWVQRTGEPITYGAQARCTGCIGGRPEIVAELLTKTLGTVSTVPRHPAVPSKRTAAIGMLRRAQGTLLGQVAGDALGSYVEFQSAEVIARTHPSGVMQLRPGGHWNTLPGQPTDDGEMALALARSIVRRGGFERDAVAESYIEWERSDPFDIGGTIVAGIDALAGLGPPDTNSQANGALCPRGRRLDPSPSPCALPCRLGGLRGRDLCSDRGHPATRRLGDRPCLRGR